MRTKTPWREQCQWVGDAQIALLDNYMTFADIALATKYLRQIPPGAERRRDPLPGHCRYPGDCALVSELFPSVVRVRVPSTATWTRVVCPPIHPDSCSWTGLPA
jgi:hypothetical protein